MIQEDQQPEKNDISVNEIIHINLFICCDYEYDI